MSCIQFDADHYCFRRGIYDNAYHLLSVLKEAELYIGSISTRNTAKACVVLLRLVHDYGIDNATAGDANQRTCFKSLHRSHIDANFKKRQSHVNS